ncbi:transmembrane protein 106A [Thalassophryne amazonica]|uniref:transmembrane protein 106A n=1 Tax=Thalassophryne amazonica TaxID=390379 RepID=UPI00147126C2|nr:transmembrane protein 106A [Thalassophryne amazonica]XP_034050546.1 transmembrane protein 106A [Thalassophryne amazonica]
MTEDSEKVKLLAQQVTPHYGTVSRNSGGTCPTCRGTGQIPTGQEDQLVAVIPCNDLRLKPSRTKWHVCVSVTVCVFVCCLILFFLFPRSVTLTPVSVLSVMVYLNPDTVDMEVTNLIKIQNQNYVSVHTVEFDIQGLVYNTVVGKTKIYNMSSIQPRSENLYTIKTDLSITDVGINAFCKSTTIKIHTLFLELQMTLNIFHLSHTEQISLNSFEYIDCGRNSTIPHPVT